MSLAATIEVNDGTLTPTGIVVAVFPGSDPTVPIELWRAADVAGAPDAANAVRVLGAIVPPGGIHYIDRLATDGTVYWYRQRLNGNAYGPGPYTDWVNLGAADRLSAEALSMLVATDAAKSSQAWKQQVARIGPQSQNILPNPGAEDGLAFWVPQAGTLAAINVPAEANGGNWYFKLTSTTGAVAQAVAGDDVGKARYFEVNPGDLVQFGGGAYRVSGTANVRYVLEATDKDKATPATVATPNQNTAAWATVQGQYVVPSGKKFVRVWAEIDATGVATVARFDDAYLRIGLGALSDVPAPNTLYQLRFSSGLPDPDTLDGLQTYIDFVAATNFMRLGTVPVAIASSTAANPTVVTTSTAHGLHTGDKVTIRGHLTNTAVNGPNQGVTVLTDTTFSLAVDTHLAAAGSGGHLVRLQLTVDSLGNLVVYAIIQAASLVVNGIATFLSTLRALGGTLVRSLQHSVTGEFGDTTVNRILLTGGDALVMGDAGTGTNKEAVRLGSHSISASAVPRTTAAFNSPATGSRGWNDPDGVDDGKNTIVATTGGISYVAAASRLYQKLGVTTEGDAVDAFDNNYTLQFRYDAAYSGTSADAIVTATVTLEYSTDSGATWTALPGSWSVTAGGSTSGFPANASGSATPTVVVPGSPTHVWFRLALSLDRALLAGGTATGNVYCFTSVYKTNNYATTWTTAGATFNRRGLKLPATNDGTNDLPSGYLEPTPTLTPVGSAGEGEIIYAQGPGNTQGFFVRRKDGWQPLGPVFELHDLAVTQVTDAGPVGSSATIKGNTINVVGTLVRITVQGHCSQATGNFYVKWNGTALTTVSVASGAGAFSQVVYAMVKTAGASGALSANVVGTAITLLNTTQAALTAQNLTADFTIEWHAWITAGTLTIDSIVIEVLTPK